MKSPQRPLVVAFDVIETLFSLEPLRPKLIELGLEPHALELWFASLLRDAFALTATGGYAPFPEMARTELEAILAQNGLEASESALKNALDTLSELPVQPDVREAFELLQNSGIRIVTISNGAKQQTQKLLQIAGLSDYVEQIISTDEVHCFKPRRDVYQHAVETAKVAPHQMALVAAHPWDVHGAASASLTTGLVKRHGTHPIAGFQNPDVEGETLVEVARGLAELPDF